MRALDYLTKQDFQKAVKEYNVKFVFFSDIENKMKDWEMGNEIKGKYDNPKDFLENELKIDNNDDNFNLTKVLIAYSLSTYGANHDEAVSPLVQTL